MKKMLIIALLILCSCNFLAFSQEVNTTISRSHEPRFFIPKNHDPNYLKSHQLPTKSFYESKADWQHIIDSTWGPGDSLSRKLLIFNTYANQVHDNFDGFISLNLNWDSLYTHYFSQIKTTTSKGAFSAIMSHFAYDLKDFHTFAFDNTLFNTYGLDPRIPILAKGGFVSVEHFGAVTTVLPDSTTLVLRVVPNHPLNLVPGDIILGYEGIPWKQLVGELFDAGIPLYETTGGCKSADTYHNLSGAGMNWHLFSTIDILKYSTGDTLHLSVLPLLNLHVPVMVNNEQMPIPNIDFPNLDPEPNSCATYGIMENTNIGYIYLASEWPEAKADAEFYKAVKALKNTDALIIDMRYNTGGWAFFDSAFSILFNEYHKTLDGAFRCNTNTFDLCPGSGYSDLHQIEGKGPSSYDRPVAVLLGPTCVSMGDRTAHRLRYLPKVKFFGKSANASFGNNTYIVNFPGWELRYSIEDVFHINKPAEYLNRREFPIDYPVWFNKDDVAIGKDPVVEKSLEWINNLVYAHDVTTDKCQYSAGTDTVIVNAIIENPNLHQVSARLYFESLDGSVTDSSDMAEVGLPGSKHWQGKWITPGIAEILYWISVKTTDNTDGTYFTSKHSSKITNVPLLIDSIDIRSYTNTIFSIRPFLKNGGKTLELNDLGIEITTNDSFVTNITPSSSSCPDLSPGQIKGITPAPIVTYDLATFPGYFNFTFSISSGGWSFWVIDTTLIITPYGLDEETQPLIYNLNQNYPNPFYPSTKISFNLQLRTFVTLKIYDLGGREVATLVSEELPAGEHLREWNAAEMPGGIYFYRLQAGVYTETRKLVLLK